MGGARQEHIKIDDEICNFIAEMLDDNVMLTLNEINQCIRARFPNKQQFAISTLSKNLPAERNRPDIIEARVEYANWLCSPDVINAYKTYVDEMGFNIWTRRSHVNIPNHLHLIYTRFNLSYV